MKVILDTKTIESINLFQNLTGSNVIDCITDDENIYFIVSENQYGMAVGKHGSKIRNAERLFKRNIKVYEYSPDLEKFVRNIIHNIQEIKIDGSEIMVKLRISDKAKVIGKGGKNIKIINKILKRMFSIDSLKIK